MPEPKKTKLMICPMMWHGDQAQVEAVMRLGCDLLPEPIENAEVFFVSRYDSPMPSAAIQAYCQSKFPKVHAWKCDRKALGFPGGCNEMAYGLLNHFVIHRHLHGMYKDIDALLIIEGDCVITRPNWIQELITEWEKAQKEGKSIVGTIQEPFAIYEWNIKRHVNAVALYDVEIVRKIPVLVGGPNQTGWDHYHGDAMIPFAYDSPLFKLDYKRPTITPEELFASQALIYHGVKDGSGIAAVRERYGI